MDKIAKVIGIASWGMFSVGSVANFQLKALKAYSNGFDYKMQVLKKKAVLQNFNRNKVTKMLLEGYLI